LVQLLGAGHQRLKAGVEQPYPENPLDADEWRILQKAAWLQGEGVWLLVRKLADLWPDVPLAN
jgi:hypothetical protein